MRTCRVKREEMEESNLCTGREGEENCWRIKDVRN
jgi:hypothetical protein